jgi:transcriptional regulator with GAF, ATPase, and Fis domain
MATESPSLIGSSSAIAGVREAIRQVADTDATVLIHGETGTGKELVARLIHVHSARRAKSFIAVNCGGLVPGLTASEMFGHEVGAFTGAVRRRVGRFEAAHRGTLFLDEVGELPADLQPLLLRVLETRAIDPIGGAQIPVDVRLVAATNRELAADVAKGRFRADLFYRLNVFPIVVPALRDRLIDVPEIASHFMRYFASQHNRPVAHIPGGSMQLLQQYDWPGNVRELRNIIERAVIASSTPELSIDPSWLVRVIVPDEPDGRTWAVQERRRILEALRATGGRIYGPSGAAQRLGLRPTTLYGKMRKHGIAKNTSSWE